LAYFRTTSEASDVVPQRPGHGAVTNGRIGSLLGSTRLPGVEKYDQVSLVTINSVVRDGNKFAATQ
jgi:hypothetical protein